MAAEDAVCSSADREQVDSADQGKLAGHRASHTHPFRGLRSSGGSHVSLRPGAGRGVYHGKYPAADMASVKDSKPPRRGCVRSLDLASNNRARSFCLVLF